MAAENILALLRVTFPDGAEQSVEITSEAFTIGRSEANDLMLTHAKVSRHHARLLLEGERISLIDLNSSNGTRIGNTRLNPNKPHRLEYGKPFFIGPYHLHLEAVSSPAQPDPPPQIQSSAQESMQAQSPVVDPEPGQLEKDGATEPASPPPRPPSPIQVNASPEGEAPVSASGSSRYLQFLPPIYEQHPFLGTFLLAFEDIVTPLEQAIDNFDMYLNPRTAPPFFLKQLAAWLALTLDENWPPETQRTVLAEAAELYRRRGTRWSLSRYLEIYTGLIPQIEEPDDQPHLFSVVLRHPKGQGLDRATVKRIIEASKPAHTIYTLEIFEEKQAHTGANHGEA